MHDRVATQPRLRRPCPPGALVGGGGGVWVMYTSVFGREALWVFSFELVVVSWECRRTANSKLKTREKSGTDHGFSDSCRGIDWPPK